MILPLGDAPNPRDVPYATYARIAINCVIYLFVTLPLSVAPTDPRDPLLAQYIRTIGPLLPANVSVNELLARTSQYDLFVFVHGYRPAAPSVVTLFESMFLHGGFMHLFGNMLFLWIYGDNVEHRLGHLAYGLWYLITGAAATLFHSLFAGSSPMPLVGASGAISGVLGFYFMWFPHNRVRLWFFLFPLFMNVVLVPARIVLGAYLLIDNLLPFLISSGSAGGGVAYGAHIGGFLAGLAVAWGVNRRGVAAVPDEFRDAHEVPTVPPTMSAEIDDALATGQGDRAAHLYFSLPAEYTRRLLHPASSLQLARWLAEHGHGQAALVVYQRQIRDHPDGPGLAEAHLGAGLVLLYLLNEPTAAYQHLVEVLHHNPDPTTATRTREVLADIAARQKMPLE
jgi:membrane associated rhomboid family serine protease